MLLFFLSSVALTCHCKHVYNHSVKLLMHPRRREKKQTVSQMNTWTVCFKMSHLFSEFLQLLLVLRNCLLATFQDFFQLFLKYSNLQTKPLEQNSSCNNLDTLRKKISRPVHFTSRSLRSMMFLEVRRPSSPFFTLTSRTCFSTCHSLLWWLIMMSICFISSWSSGSHDDRTELQHTDQMKARLLEPVKYNIHVLIQFDVT